MYQDQPWDQKETTVGAAHYLEATCHIRMGSLRNHHYQIDEVSIGVVRASC